MHSLFQFLFEHFFLIFGFVILWNLVIFTYLHRKRQKRGVNFPNPTDPEVVFTENKASGSSLKSFQSKYGGASRVLTVTVTKTHLSISTHFPFTALAQRFDTEHLIPLSDIISATPKGKLIEVEFLLEDGSPRKYSLLLKDPHAFLSAVQPEPPQTTSAY